MDTGKKMGPEAAATAIRTPAVISPEKQTVLLCPKSERRASEFLETGTPKATRQSLRAAINAMCKSCLYDPGNGNGAWREQVRGCSSSACALHHVRPLPVKARKSSKDASRGSLAPVAANDGLDALSASTAGHNDVTSKVGRAA